VRQGIPLVVHQAQGKRLRRRLTELVVYCTVLLVWRLTSGQWWYTSAVVMYVSMRGVRVVWVADGVGGQSAVRVACVWV